MMIDCGGISLKQRHFIFNVGFGSDDLPDLLCLTWADGAGRSPACSLTQLDDTGYLVVDRGGRRDQGWTEGRHTVLQNLLGYKRNPAADIVRGLREVDAVSS